NHLPDQWPHFLDRECAGAPDLRCRVEALLAAHREASPATSRVGGVAMTTVDAQIPGTVIGPYKLLEVIGPGGMGTVYLAEQSQPVKREVALKIIKPGMDSDRVVARFEAERQALAIMDHPNIAKVFDGGMTNEGGQVGRPYFVMELVRGLPITTYCD